MSVLDMTLSEQHKSQIDWNKATPSPSAVVSHFSQSILILHIYLYISISISVSIYIARAHKIRVAAVLG